MSEVTEHWRFLPALDAVVHEPPRRAALVVSRLVMGLVLLLLAWGVLGRIDVVVVAPGRLVPETRVKIVQPAMAGVVRRVLVREGDVVQAGQLLLQLDDTVSSAEAADLQQRLALRELELRRLDAELAAMPLRRQAGDDPALYRLVQARYSANRAAWVDTVADARASHERARSEWRAAQEELRRLQLLRPVHEAELAAVEALRDKGFVSALDYNARRRAVIDAAQGVQAQQARVDALAAAERQAGLALAAITSRRRADIERERTLLTAERQQLQQQLARQQHDHRALALRAPQAGVVKDMAVHAPGTVVSPGAVLLSLVPRAERLLAEVWVRNEDIGHLRPGQAVQVKVHAYRFQKYGMLAGTVARISPDAAADGARDAARDAAPGASAGGEAPGYRVTVLVDGGGDGPVGREMLAAGMAVTAEVGVGTRSPLAYLLEPLRGVVLTAGRET